MAEPVVTALLKVLFENILNKLHTVFSNEFRLIQGGLFEDLDRLSTTLAKFQHVLQDAEVKDFKSAATTDWLRRLKYVEKEAVGILDEAMDSDSDSDDDNQTRVRRPFPAFIDFNRVTIRHNLGERIRSVRQKIDLLDFEKTTLDFEEIDMKWETTSTSSEPKVFGRNEAKEEITKALLNGADVQTGGPPFAAYQFERIRFRTVAQKFDLLDSEKSTFNFGDIDMNRETTSTSSEPITLANTLELQSEKNPIFQSMEKCRIIGGVFIAIVMYLICFFSTVFNTDSPVFSFDTVSVRGFNSSQSAVVFSGKVLNPNENVEFYFSKKNQVKVSTDTHVELFRGSLPAFFVAAKETTGYQAELSATLEYALLNEEMTSSNITLKFAFKLPVKPSVYFTMTWFKIWTTTWKLHCDLVIYALANNNASIRSYTCDDNAWHVFWGK